MSKEYYIADKKKRAREIARLNVRIESKQEALQRLRDEHDHAIHALWDFLSKNEQYKRICALQDALWEAGKKIERMKMRRTRICDPLCQIPSRSNLRPRKQQ